MSQAGLLGLAGGLGAGDPLGGQQESSSFKGTFLEMDSFIQLLTSLPGPVSAPFSTQRPPPPLDLLYILDSEVIDIHLGVCVFKASLLIYSSQPRVQTCICLAC